MHQPTSQPQYSHISSTFLFLSTAAVTSSYLYYNNIIRLLKKKTNRDNQHHQHHHTCDYDILTTIPDALQLCPYINELNVAIELALQCGSNIYQHCYYKGTVQEDKVKLQIQTKGQPEDFCTMIDILNENIVMNGIRKNFPNHNIIGEESVGTGVIPAINPAIPTWVIDPIDGTTNFVSGIPLSCVSIGYCINGRPTLGVIYAPMTNEIYIGVIGYGAYRNGISIRQQNCTEPMRSNVSLKESVIGFEFGYVRDPIGIQKMISVLQNIMLYGCRTVRSLGSGVLDLLYVATHKLDLVYAGVASEGWKPWDYCAAYVIVKEAGCIMDTLYQQQENPNEFNIYSNSVICAIHQSLVDEFRHEILKQP
jgi:fructose-1,6-bisphosphatase/inositol monophosphatase family enzyme